MKFQVYMLNSMYIKMQKDLKDCVLISHTQKLINNLTMFRYFKEKKNVQKNSMGLSLSVSLNRYHLERNVGTWPD